MPYAVKWVPTGQQEARTTGLVYATPSEAMDCACAVLERGVGEIWIEDEGENRIVQRTITEYCRSRRLLR
jgi:hypothetical protein